MLPFSPENSVNRREFLFDAAKFIGKIGFLAAVPALLQDDAPPETWWRSIENALSFPWTEQEVVVYSQDRIFTATNPRLILKPLGERGYAYVLTHMGYTEYRISDESKYLQKVGKSVANPSFKEEYQLLRDINGGFYGDYHEYIRNLERLVRSLDEKGEPTIFAEEHYVFYNPQLPRPSLRPFDSAMIAVTNSSNPVLIDKVKTTDGEVNQDAKLMYATLKRAGVKEVRMGGEFVNTRTGANCLGTMANMLTEQGFVVRGIEGCMYPLRQHYPSNDPGIRSLYRNMLSLKDLTSAA